LTNGPCIYDDTTTVYINPLPIITVQPPSALVCSGGGLSLSASGAVTYKWSPSHGLNATTGSAVYAGADSATTYTVFGTDSVGCIGKTTVTINVAAQPIPSFTETVPSPCTPQQLQFTNTTPGDSLTFMWRFGDGSSSTEENPLHNYSSTGKFKVTLVVTSPNGCVDSVSKEETVTAVEFVLIPSAFTPAGEEANRLFKPNVLCSDVSDYVFRVYNRWGMQIYETNDATATGWDGSYNGQPQPLDTYVYYMQMTCGTCNVFKKGNVTLVR
jgi:gliding motility-associated-like protein